MTGCDKCDRKYECYKENRLIAYTTLEDQRIIPELGGNAHVLIGPGQDCPKIIDSEYREVEE